ncbi:hypothetical protein BBK36DRAFT_1197945 [Trichoderma citrinoviride]|uniref:Uncharacterized protein n=1 Tax=Trichoderma citrinoviride TaxID=58853 RepID=A0A2T4BBG4_9HYPO|nr:hypothetical protein BBK36DRAFT_1197945 [Trichoderma citrinoviride]PTB66628.1 hypothetical protein BBK36DRAFT_1197945 [Trichoderma citrinoviride]
MGGHRNSYGYGDDEYHYSYSSTPPRSRYPEFSRNLDKDHVRTAARPDRGREIGYNDRPARRHYDDYGDRKQHDEAMYRREDRPSRHRGRSLHNEEDAEYRWRGGRHRSRPSVRAHSEHRLVEAATAGLAAGVTEVVRARHDSDRGRRAVTAAISAAAVDALVSKGDERNRGRHLVESAVGGLLIDRLANGRSAK